jgi:hypothetical protein
MYRCFTLIVSSNMTAAYINSVPLYIAGRSGSLKLPPPPNLQKNSAVTLIWKGWYHFISLLVVFFLHDFKGSLSRNINKMQLCNRIYYSKVYWRLNMFRAANHSSSGALNCICSLWFIYLFGYRPLSRLSGKCIFNKLWNNKFYY